ncbi:hypothetical protein Gohar_025554 [Gossypium harknessii]|uniref:RNase H type-1 domain-containing protein n=1 Tax=Gossypium harknessii TaxID=34285 RepID=A0A7J9IC40_9ROSI|nr:hypothetical protein [Gossypium harknessii]
MILVMEAVDLVLAYCHLDISSGCLVKVDISFAAAGGVLRDQNENWILGYNRYLGFCSVIEDELWGIMDGSSLLLERSYDNVIIQIDNIEVVLAIQDQACND